MHSFFLARFAMLPLIVAACLPACCAWGQHADVMVQHEGGLLVTGLAELEGGSFSVPRQVFTGNFLSNFRTADPGFFALSEGNPQLPAEALPPSSGLYWDFLPMTVDQTVSNLYFWDGIDHDMNGLTIDDVDFVRPTNAAFKVINNGTFTADASDQMVAGGLVDTTAFDGSIHKHPAYRIETLDASTPPAGIYLVSMQVRMDGFTTSDPFFLALRTSTMPTASLVAARDWIDANIDMLTSPPLLAGDYNGDGLVNLADYTVWRDTLGSTANLAANGDDTGTSQGVIDAADYVFWKSAFAGSSLAALATTATASAVPEPTSGLLTGLGLLAIVMRTRFRS